MKTYIAAFFLLLSATFVAAHPYLIQRLGIEQGLSNNYVLSITQDKQGFLWFATEEGLNKFDGTRFITYYKEEQSSSVQSITGNELNEVYADPVQPVIWIATQRAGLNAYNYETQSFSVYQYNPEDPQSLITNDVTHITSSVQAGKGLWVCTYYRGIEYLDIATGKFTHYNKSTVPALPSEQTWTATEAEDGKLYIGHVEGGLSILSLNDKSVKHFVHDPQNPNSLPGNDVRCIYKDTNGNIWIGTSKGLALFNANTETFTNFHNNPGNIHGALSSYIFSIKQLKDNKLWIATELNGIMILDLQQNQFLLPEQIRFEFIREGDNNHIILLGGAQWNGNFKPFKDSKFDDKIMYTCHRYGGDPTKDAIQTIIDFRDSVNLPMYMGEIGHNTDEWQAAFCQTMRENNIGYTFWPYKKMDGSSFVGITPPENWANILYFSESPRTSYKEIRDARPDQMMVRKAMMDFIEACKLKNCVVQEGYIQSLGMK